MLGGADHTRVLRTLDRCTAHYAGQQRIFRDIFEIAPVARIARQIDAAAEQYVEAARAGLLCDDVAALPREFGVEARAKGKTRGQSRGGVALAHAERIGDAQARVGLAQRRDAEPRHAADVACTRNDIVRPDHLGIAEPGDAQRHETVDQRKPLVIGHLGFSVGGPAVGGRLALCLRGRAGLGGDRCLTGRRGGDACQNQRTCSGGLHAVRPLSRHCLGIVPRLLRAGRPA